MSDRRSRRTSDEVLADIRAAVRAQLDEGGYDSVTLEGIARRANVSKPVLYRRFSSRVLMVTDAMGDITADIGDPASTTSLRDDLVAWLNSGYRRAVALGSSTYRGVIGEADPETLDRITAIRRSLTALMDEKAIEPARRRGELGPLALDRETLLAPFRLLESRVIFAEESPSVEHIVDGIALPLFRLKSGWTPPPSPSDG